MPGGAKSSCSPSTKNDFGGVRICEFSDGKPSVKSKLIPLNNIGVQSSSGTTGPLPHTPRKTLKETRTTFLFTKQKGDSALENLDIYRAECNIIVNEDHLQITGCKVYYTPSHFARQNITITRVGSEGPAAFIGVCGRAHLIPEEEWTPILLSGITYDLLPNPENTYILTPPKSFFVEGEHENFVPPGKYPLAFFKNC